MFQAPSNKFKLQSSKYLRFILLSVNKTLVSKPLSENKNNVGTLWTMHLSLLCKSNWCYLTLNVRNVCRTYSIMQQFKTYKFDWLKFFVKC